MEAVWRGAKLSLYWAIVAGVTAGFGFWFLVWFFLLIWGDERGYVPWQAYLIESWLLFLSGAKFFLTPAVAITARNPMQILNFAGAFWPAGTTLVLLGGSHIVIAVAVALSGPIGDTTLDWGLYLLFLNLINILAAFSAALAAIVTQMSGGNRRAVYTLGFLYVAVAAHTVVVVVFLGTIAAAMSEAYRYRGEEMVLTWLGLSGGLTVLGVLSWRQGRAVFTLAGAAMAAVAFAGAWFYAPPFYGGGLPYASWHPVWMCAVPLLLFLAVLRRGRVRGFGRAG